MTHDDRSKGKPSLMKAILAIFMLSMLAMLSAKADEDGYDFTKMIQPVPLSAKFEDPGFVVWCGTMIRDEKGTYHLYYSRWPRALGHYGWVTHSEVAHATADHPLGPYKFADVALPARSAEKWDGHCTHNPTVMKFGSKYYLYYMGNTGDRKKVKGLNWDHRGKQRIGVAVADSPAGPWTRSDEPLIDATPGFHDALANNNPSVVQRAEGDYLMVYKAIGNKGEPPSYGPVVHIVATSDSPTGPFKKHPNPVFTKAGEAFPAEDPYIWRGKDRYWAIVKDFKGVFTGKGTSLALFDSANGIDWELSSNPLVSTLNVAWGDGRSRRLHKLERPQIYFEDGEPAVLFCAAAMPGKLHDSFIIMIPLKRHLTNGG